MSNFQMHGGAIALFYPSPSDDHGCVYSVNVGKFMSWLNIYLRFKLCVEASDNEIRTCIEPLVITNRNKTRSNAFRNCFWRTSLLYHLMVM